jgi:hypothetical protein
MSSNGKIQIEELRRAVNILLDHLRDGGIREVELGHDYYWECDAEHLYNVTKNPTDFSIGSLFDDWESVQKLTQGQDEAVVLLLLKVAPLLRYLGDAVTEVQLTKSAFVRDSRF